MICEYCNKDMLLVDTCTATEVEFPSGEILASIPNQKEDVCHDCCATRGKFHHPGCDMEQCPKCQGQIISCGHLD
jgi:hypothetical protein